MENMENSVKPHENKMGTMPMTRLILTMSLPAIFSMTIQAMYNVVDSIFIGNYDADGLTATSLAYPLQMLLIAFAVGTAVGVNSFVSRKLGEKNFVQANDGATHGLVTCIFNYVIFLLLGLFAVRPFMAMYTQNEAILNYGIQYLTVVLCFSFFSIVQIMVEKTLQATGNMIAPMWFQIAGVVFNFVFDPLLIFGIGPFPKMGVVGAAVATVLGYVVSTIIALIQLFLTKQKVKPVFKNCLEPKMIKLIFSYGLPSFVMNALGAFTVNFANMFLVRYSDTAVAFFGAYFKVQQLIFMTVNGLIQGCLPIMRFNYRAKEYGRLKQANKSGTIIATVMMIVGMLLVLIFPKEILFLFSASEEMCAFGVPAMRIMSLGFVFSGFSAMIATYEQATDSIMPGVVVQLLRQGVLLVPVIWLLNSAVQMTGIWLAFPITEFVTFLVAVVFAKIKNH